MRLQLALASAALSLSVALLAPPADAQGYGDFAGQWSSSEGAMSLSSSGGHVSGTYTQDNGRIDGYQSGGQLTGYWGEDGSAQDCGTERLGTRHWGRIAWTLSPDGSHFSGAWSYCDGNPDHSWTGDRTGGAPYQPPPNGGGGLTTEPGIDRPGQDYRSFDLPQADPGLCRSACASETQCRAYTYVRPGVQGPSARCWLKSGVPDQVQNGCCVSGTHGDGAPSGYPPPDGYPPPGNDNQGGYEPDHHDQNGWNTPPPNQEPRLLYELGNIYACGFTDHSEFDLDRPTHLQKLELWYNWAAGQTSLDYTVSQNGRQMGGGTLQRGACDPYQTAWCQAVDQPDVELSPGHYVVTVRDRATICQNSGSNNRGFIKIYGW